MSQGHETSPTDRRLQCRYLKCRENLRTARATVRRQAEKSRQLIAAVTEQLLMKDEEAKKVNYHTFFAQSMQIKLASPQAAQLNLFDRKISSDAPP